MHQSDPLSSAWWQICFSEKCPVMLSPVSLHSRHCVHPTGSISSHPQNKPKDMCVNNLTAMGSQGTQYCPTQNLPFLIIQVAHYRLEQVKCLRVSYVVRIYPEQTCLYLQLFELCAELTIFLVLSFWELGFSDCILEGLLFLLKFLLKGRLF